MPTSITIKNMNQLNYLKIKAQVAETAKDGKPILGKWKDKGTDSFIKPGTQEQVWVDQNNRFIVEEMPS